MTKPIVLDFKTWDQWDAFINRLGSPKFTVRNTVCDNCGIYSDCTFCESGARICALCAIVEKSESA